VVKNRLQLLFWSYIYLVSLYDAFYFYTNFDTVQEWESNPIIKGMSGVVGIWPILFLKFILLISANLISLKHNSKYFIITIAAVILYTYLLYIYYNIHFVPYDPNDNHE
jgi:hypothetical protein